MEYTTLGNTGMRVSQICLGCLSIGRGEWRDWTLDEDESRELLEQAIDLGINFFDTANVYALGASEEVLGDVLTEHDRDQFVVSTKGYFQIDRDNPNSGGLSRKALDRQIQGSLERLGMETIDLYHIHCWDYETPIEVTLRMLDDAVRRGDIRYIGGSTMWARQLATALRMSEAFDLERFATMQNHYNLVYREEEREMLPLCRNEDVSVIPWSPLARGYLARPDKARDDTVRAKTENDQAGGSIYEHPYREQGGKEINRRIEELSNNYGVSMAQIALAWLLHKDWVDAPIVGVTSLDHLKDAVEAVSLDLNTCDIEYLEEPYEPVHVSPDRRVPKDRYLR